MYLHNMLIFVGCLVSYVQCQKICKKNQYTVFYSNGSFYCLNCDTCHEGRGLHPACGSRIRHPPKPDCKACLEGTFSDELDSAPCHSCQKCAEHEIVTAPCTSRSDRVCNGTCEAGFFYSKKDSTHSCQKCAYCCSDGKDEVISECVNQGSNASKRHCRPRPDKECSPGSSLPSPTDSLVGNEASESGSLSTESIVGIVFGVVSPVIIIIVTLVMCLLYRTRKNQGELGVTGPAAENYAQNGPRADPTVPYNQSDAPSSAVVPAEYHREPGSEAAAATTGNQADDKIEKLQYGTPCKMSSKSPLSRQNSRDSQNNRDEETGFRKRSNSAIRMEKLARKLSEKDDSLLEEDMEGSEDKMFGDSEDPAATTVNQADDKIKKLQDGTPCKMSSKSPLSRQNSRDSQNNRDGETGFRKRSNSAIRMEKLARKLSEKDDSLLEEDIKGSEGPITITKELSSQMVKEGSKVELVYKCKAVGNRKLTYQWYKDGIELQTRNDDTLVLKPVKLQDFGFYKCVASYEDSPSVSVESLAELNVRPRDGTRYKCLGDVDFNTQNRIGKLLTQKSYGLGCWRQVASKYGMDELDIKHLENDREAGKNTLEYLRSSHPDLVVYDFCKALKDHSIRRLDIVKELLEHLSVPSSSNVYV